MVSQRSSKNASPPFMGTVRAKSPRGAHAVVFGAPHGTPYKSISNRPHETAPNAFRQALKDDALWSDHWDFDFGGPLLPATSFKAVDIGNLPTRALDGKGNRKKIEATTRAILDAGAVPIMFGGDDSVPIPFLSAFSASPPITVLQIDAHIDWRHERERETLGFSSTMRRASEQAHVWRIVQAGIRGLGSAREAEVRDALKWGSHIVTSHEIHQRGIGTVLEHITPGSQCLITLDLDSLDAAAMPAVAAPSPGGLTYLQVTDLIAGVAAKATIAGFAMVEFVAKRDPFGVAAYTAGRIACHVLHRIAQQRG